LNLVLNARDAMPEGGTISLEVGLVQSSGGNGQGWGEISISDEGVGMPKAVLKQALDPFFTTKEQRRGGGLGLSQVRSLADDSGGKLQIESLEGKGTTVRLRLPLARGDTEGQALEVCI